MADTDRAALRVEVPDRSKDHPSWVKIGVIAAVGFVVGVAWPRLVGLQLGPKPPETAQSAASAASSGAPAADAAHSASAAPGPVSASVQATASASASANRDEAQAPVISIGHGNVLSCKTTDGEGKKGKECGAVAGLDPLVVARAKRLSSCQAVLGKTGRLSTLVTLDFAAGKAFVEAGRSSTVEGADAISACLKKDMQGLAIATLDHEHPRYVVAYNVTLTKAAGEDPGTTKPAAASVPSGEAKTEEPREGGQITWEVALVRDAPKSGAIVARLPRGTKVKLGASKDGWYRIQYKDGAEGWVYRGALGK